MKQPPPIPIPFRQRWHDFKTEYLPIVTFVLLCVAILWMWGRYVNPSTIVGKVEAVRAKVVTLYPGTLQELKAEPFQHVTNGQCVAVIKLLNSGSATNETNQVTLQCTYLYSPIDGYVSEISHRCGENIMPGDSILEVCAESSDRVYAWVRHPVTQAPTVGEEVKVHRPTMGQAAVVGKVIEVGHQFESISSSALPVTSTQTKPELGLPFLVQLPADAHLTPGEPVHLKFVRTSLTR